MKRQRDGTEVDHNLVQIYDDLASEAESIRLTAATSLIKTYTANEAQQKAIVIRLFRGLCSGRKAARLGFAIALTEILSSLPHDGAISRSEILDILEKHTRPESGTSGQDERDHYFGRLFGSEAIIRSEMLFNQQDQEQWDRLLDIMLKTVVQKPWLRQSCGWTLYTCVRTSLIKNEQQQFAVRILEKLTEHKLIRTPEGRAVWIEVRRHHPAAKLPKNVWKDNNPLSPKDLTMLANVLKDAKEVSNETSEHESQGSAMWAANLHFVWDVVLTELLAEPLPYTPKHREHIQQFWQVAVDQSLFKPSNSKERKHWGLLVMIKAFDRIGPDNHIMIEAMFSKNATDCLLLSLKSTESYLQRTARLLTEKMVACAAREPDAAFFLIITLLEAVDFVDFDSVTKTKTSDSLVNVSSSESMIHLAENLHIELIRPSLPETEKLSQKQRLVLNYSHKLLTLCLQRISPSHDLCEESADMLVVKVILEKWLLLTSSVPAQLDEAGMKLVTEKLHLALEQVLKLDRLGRFVIIDLVADCEDVHSERTTDPVILVTISDSQRRIKRLRDKLKLRNQTTSVVSFEEISSEGYEVLAMLYALLLLEFYSGDYDSITLLQELIDLENDILANGAHDNDASAAYADTAIDIILSFASRPSKFLRRITLNIFEMITSKVTRQGLQNFADILTTKESKAGQTELFQELDNEVEGSVDNDSDQDEASDVEMLDSDVEVVNASEASSDNNDDSEAESTASRDGVSPGSQSSTGSDAESDSGSTSASESEGNPYAALEEAVAKVLGTRKFKEGDLDATSSNSNSPADSDATSSDSSMGDDDMLALDDKLAEVFRTRAAENKSNSKKEHRFARENVINFKNRVLDMLEVYLKRENQQSQCLEIILPLLQVARGNTKQLADRAVKILTMFCKRCSGLEKVPTLQTTSTEIEKTGKKHVKDEHDTKLNGKPNKNQKKNQKRSKQHNDDDEDMTDQPPPSPGLPPITTEETLSLLRGIHTEASLANTSNAHRGVSSKTSILVVKSLLKAGVKIDEVQAIYDETDTKRKENPEECKVAQGFFDDWVNWRKSVKARVG